MKLLLTLSIVTAMLCCTLMATTQERRPAVGADERAAPGQLTILSKDRKPLGLCPLKGTKMDAEVEGFGARVTVTQTFTNPSKVPIEAIYTFPLPENAAVDRMRMQIGTRSIVGAIKKREEARKIYEAAKSEGKISALLDQERPNIFTQSLANIMPGAEIRVEISYVQILKYEQGMFKFDFPMVVGPRFVNENTKDPGKVSPPVTPKGTRTGAAIECNVRVNAGIPILSIESVLHKIDLRTENGSSLVQRAVTQANLKDAQSSVVRVQLSAIDEIPNRDFILKFGVAGSDVTSSLLTVNDAKKGGFFSLILVPPKQTVRSQIMPKEMIFVMDQSGSQRGFPIEKSVELCKKLIENMNPSDTFNVIGFSNTAYSLWKSPQANSPRTRAEAIGFLEQMEANGGTQLEKAVVASLDSPSDPRRQRVVVFNTDGLAGSEAVILDTIRKYKQDARLFTFGIGNSVNRYLIQAMCQEGRGDYEVVTLASKADESVNRFYQRLNNPVMTDVKVEFDGVAVTDVYPKQLPDVFSESPVVVFGRYTGSGKGIVRLSGETSSGGFVDEIPIEFGKVTTSTSSIISLWARNRIKEIETDAYIARANGVTNSSIQREIEEVALEHSLMSPFTSFVAVEERIVNNGGKVETVSVPVEMADGVEYESGADMNRKLRAGAPASAGLAGGGGGFGGSSGPTQGTGGRVNTIQPGISPAAKAGEKLKESANKGTTSNDAKKQNIEQKLAPSLKKVTGRVKIQVWLTGIDARILDAIVKLGFVIMERGISQPVVFAEGDSAKLIELVQLAQVKRVKPY